MKTDHGLECKEDGAHALTGPIANAIQMPNAARALVVPIDRAKARLADLAQSRFHAPPPIHRRVDSEGDCLGNLAGAVYWLSNAGSPK